MTASVKSAAERMAVVASNGSDGEIAGEGDSLSAEVISTADVVAEGGPVVSVFNLSIGPRCVCDEEQGGQKE